MSGHTPGPWQIRPGVFNYQIDIRVGRNTLATVYGSTGENLCNASLIAAAPELLKALDGMLSEVNEQMPGIVHDELSVIFKARAAIAKARGEA